MKIYALKNRNSKNKFYHRGCYGFSEEGLTCACFFDFKTAKTNLTRIKKRGYPKTPWDILEFDVDETNFRIIEK